jgi:redox-sensitive bicupin YhaK (pirin superfamily)
MRARTATALDAIVELHADGLAAWMLRLPPGAPAIWPEECGGAARHIMVAAGTLIHDGKPLPYESLAFAHAGEGGPVATAGPEGAEVLIMQYPQPDPALLEGASAPYSMDGR